MDMGMMPRAAKYILATGEITGIRTGVVLSAPPPGMAYRYLADDEACDPDRHRIVDDAIVAKLAIGAETLARWRFNRWLAAKAYRETYSAGGCMTPLGRVDTDDASRQKISGAVQMAMIALSAGEPFSIAWTMSDNSIVAHDAPAMIAMGVTVGRFVDACQRASVAIRDAINASDDPAEIDIYVGYPA